jgi:hypothetical protein
MVIDEGASSEKGWSSLGSHSFGHVSLWLGLVVWQIIIIAVPYAGFGHKIVRKYGWRALLPVQRRRIGGQAPGQYADMESAWLAVVDRLYDGRSSDIAPEMTSIRGGSYRLKFEGDTYWLSIQQMNAFTWLTIRVGLPCPARMIHQVGIYIGQLLMVPILDSSGMACFIAEEMAAELDRRITHHASMVRP